MALSPRLQKYYRIVSQSVEAFTSGTWDIANNEQIPKDASQDSLNWVVIDGMLQLVGGRSIVGNQGLIGGVNKEWFAYRSDGTAVHFHKAQTKIQVLVGSTWTDVITGLTASAKYTFANYTSLAGNFVFIGGVDGIYKIHTANPTSYIQLKKPADIYCGFLMIDKARTRLWNLPKDKTGLYGSHIDNSPYTIVADENLGTGDSITTVFSGTLAAKSPFNNVFALNLITTGSPKTITNITKEAIPEVTAVGHGFATNDTIYFTGLPATQTATGTVSVSGGTGQLTISGTSTHFSTELLVGSQVSIGGVICTIHSIASDISMVADTGSTIMPTFTGTMTIYNMTELNGVVTTVGGVIDADHFRLVPTKISTAGYTPFALGPITPTVASQFSQAVDDFNGNVIPVSPSTGITGTINYTTGQYSFTYTTPPATGAAILINYQWEDSNTQGITDFTSSATRLAGQGYSVRQDEGGDAIQLVITGPDGKYYSMKSRSVYQFSESSDDTSQTNVVFRKDIGVPSSMSAVSTGLGIIFMNTGYPSKPELTILTSNALGDNLIPKVLFPQFKFANYTYDQDTVVDFYDRFVLISCKSSGATTNDTLIIGDVNKKSIQVTSYGASSFAKDGVSLYAGSPLENTTYQIFNGFDDLDNVIENFWESRGEFYGDNANLHKIRRIRLAGLIDANQSYEVYISFDDSAYQLIGTIIGHGDYVDNTDPQTVGSNMVGTADIGGDSGTTVYPYFTEIKVGKCPKYRKRSIKFVALGYGFVSIRRIEDWDILHFENRLPSRMRQKQNVSLDGTQTDLPLPDH